MFLPPYSKRLAMSSIIKGHDDLLLQLHVKNVIIKLAFKSIIAQQASAWIKSVTILIDYYKHI